MLWMPFGRAAQRPRSNTCVCVCVCVCVCAWGRATWQLAAGWGRGRGTCQCARSTAAVAGLARHTCDALTTAALRLFGCALCAAVQATWGMNGYVELARGGSKKSGECGIASQPSYPIAGGSPGPSPPSPPSPSPPPPGPSPPGQWRHAPSLSPSVQPWRTAAAPLRAPTVALWARSAARVVRACVRAAKPGERKGRLAKQHAVVWLGVLLCCVCCVCLLPGPKPKGKHYEDPNNGPCSKGEEAVQITGVKGSFCSPKCKAPVDDAGAAKKNCPKVRTDRRPSPLRRQTAPTILRRSHLDHERSHGGAQSKGVSRGKHRQALTIICFVLR